jgi:hypothetical protein
MSDFTTLPDRLEASGTDLNREAAERIVELEEQLVKARGDAAFHAERVKKLRAAIVGHRGQRDFAGGKIQADTNLWHFVADVPWGEPIQGDG